MDYSVHTKLAVIAKQQSSDYQTESYFKGN